MSTPIGDHALALAVERAVPERHVGYYLECMGGTPMSLRKTDREIRDGCIITHHVYFPHTLLAVKVGIYKGQQVEGMDPIQAAVWHQTDHVDRAKIRAGTAEGMYHES